MYHYTINYRTNVRFSAHKCSHLQCQGPTTNDAPGELRLLQMGFGEAMFVHRVQWMKLPRTLKRATWDVFVGPCHDLS